MNTRYYPLIRRGLSALFVCNLLISAIPVAASKPPNTVPLVQSNPTKTSFQQGDVPTDNIQPEGTIAFLSGPNAGDALDIALAYIQTQRFALGLSESDLADMVLKDRYVSQHNGVTHLYFRQRWQGIEVYNGDININILLDGSVINLGNRFVANLAELVNGNTPAMSPIAAVQSVGDYLGIQARSNLVVTSAARGADSSLEISGASFASQPIPLRLIYMPISSHRVQLAWTMIINRNDSPDVLDLRVDATTGEILSVVNLTSDVGMHLHTSDGQESNYANELQSPSQSANLAPPANSYYVYPLPANDPHDSPRVLVSNPADTLASPFGWHDTNGAAGADFTTTRGNNTFTYADLTAPDGFGAGDLTVDAGAGLVFSDTADLAQPAISYTDASITNLFYLTNKIHDTLYHYGFDEASGNFQLNNYGRGGLGNDSVLAEAQDYSGFNNANFSTPIDGMAPRMQMYLASPKSASLSVQVISPTLNPATVAASFGSTSYNLTATVTLIDDGVAPINDGCTTITNNISGTIALIDRGLCSFQLKAKNAENAGAVGVLIVDNVLSLTPPTLGSDNSVAAVSIPANSLILTDGNTIKNALQSAAVTVNMARSVIPGNDGSLDNNVVIHEYGHGLSNRLTGGASNSNCLTTNESGGMGEGWSDFLALVMTAQPSQTRTSNRFIGRWLFNQDANGSGLRHYFYSTDLATNPLTFATIGQTNPFSGLVGEVHDVGEVWAATLWEVYWNLVDAHGFDADIVQGTGGNNLALQLVIDGMKLQPCNPTFVEARNAILQADMANNGGANLCKIWEGFAKRGLGYSASAGNASSVEDSVEAFDLPPSCMIAVQPTLLDICLPASANFDVAIGESFIGAATLSVSNAPAGTTPNFSPNPISSPNHSTLSLAGVNSATPGNYTFAVVGTGISQTYTTTAVLKVSAATPTTPTLTAPANHANEVSALPTFSWQAAAQATSYIFEISEEASFATTFYSNTISTTSLTLPYSLRSARTYYWRVTASNICGAITSASATFTIRTFPQLLLVDDDGKSSGIGNAQTYYVDALNALQIPFDLWDTGSGNDEPTRLDEIADYSTILWFTGPTTETPMSSTESILSQYLDQNGCFALSAMDYFYARGITPFSQDYLGLAAAIDDLGNGVSWQTVVTGTAPIFTGQGPYSLAFIDGNYSDILTPTVDAGVAFVGDAGNAALYKDGGNYRTLYFGFELETLPTNALSQTLASLVDWCEFQTDLSIQHSLNTTTSVKPGQPITYTLVYSNSGDHVARNIVLTTTLPAALLDINAHSAQGSVSAIDNSPAVWSVSDLAAGATNTVTIGGKVDPQSNSDAILNFAASISSASFEQNSSDNQTDSASVTLVVPRLQWTTSQITAAEESAVAIVQAALDQVNPYASVQANFVGSNGTATAGSDFPVISNTLTIPAGLLTTQVAISLTNDSLLEASETFVVQLQNAKGAALATPISTSVTITDSDLPSVYFARSAYTVTESSGNALLRIELDQLNPDHEVIVYYRILTLSRETITPATAVTLSPGTLATTITLPIPNDNLVEADETRIVELYEPVNATLGNPFEATLLVTDDDVAPADLQIEITSEPVSGTVVAVNEIVTFTVVISNAGRAVGAGALTVTVPSNLRYIEDSAVPAPSNRVARVIAAQGDAATASQLVWTWDSIAADGSRQIRYSLQVLNASTPVQSQISLSSEGATLPVTDSVQLPVQNLPATMQRVYLPVIQR